MAAQLSSSCLISANHKLPTYTHTALMSSSTSAETSSMSQAQLYASHGLNHMANHSINQASDQFNNLNESCSLDNQSLQHDEQSLNESFNNNNTGINTSNKNNSNNNLNQHSDNFYHGDHYYRGMNYTNNNNNNSGVKCPGSLLAVDEYESKSSSDNPDECEHELPSDGRPAKKRYHRHSQYQIQEMERVFKECPHPDEKQRLELSRELKLDPRQVKFWFQNKRTQVKAQHERHDNSYLRTENEKLRAENLALRDAIANVTCPSCGGPAALSDVSFDDQQLRIENVRLREEIDRISKIAAKHVGRPISTLNLGSSALASPTSTTNSTLYLSTENQGGNNNIGTNNSSSLVENEASNQSPLLLNHKPLRLMEAEKPMVIELAMGALEELTQVAQASDPLWVLDPLTGLETLDPHLYLQRFPPHHLLHTPSPLSSNFRRESTRDSSLVMMDSSSLVDIFMNVSAWAEMFSCIVSTAVPIEVLSSGTSNSPDGAMQIIYAEFQLPTPMVSTRESYFIRYAKRINSHQAMWVVVDVSIDNLLRGNSMSTPLVRCRRHPSGCIIEELPNGYSKVTWVEHSEIDEHRGLHRLYEQLVRSGMAFGAQRWLATLHRQCESIHAANIAITSPTKDLVSPTTEGRRSILKLAERMTNSFCGGVSASVAHTWITLSTGGSNASTSNDGPSHHHVNLVGKGLGMPSINGGSGDAVPTLGEDVRVLVRKSVDDPGRPPGVVLCAATSIWLPIPPSRVFKYLQDQSFRNEWDILSNMGAVEEIMRVPKGHDDGNSVSLLRVNASSSNQPNMLILQECCAEETSYVVVYAPVDIAAMSSVINGGDPECVALLPSGFSIFPDRPHYRMPNNDAPNRGTPTFSSPGSLLTVAFQILVDHVPTAKLSLGSVATVNNLISSTVLRIKNALACDSAYIS